MEKELKLEAVKGIVKYIIIGIVCSLGILLILYFCGSLKNLIDGPKKMETLKIKELPDAYVDANINQIYAGFADYYEKNKKTGKETVTKRYYIIPVGKKEVIALEVDSSSGYDLQKAEEVYNDTLEYIMGNKKKITSSMSVTGTVNKMDTDVYKYYKDWFKTSGYLKNPTDRNIQKIALPYVLQIGYVGQLENVLMYGLFFIIGIICLMEVIMILILLTGAYASQLNKTMRQVVSEAERESMEQDFRNAKKIHKVWVGKKNLYYILGNKIRITPLSELAWAYSQNVTHSVYGIKVYVQKTLMLYNRKKKRTAIYMFKSKYLDAALNEIAAANPQIVIGYSNELKKLFKKNDVDTFLGKAGVKSMEESATE
jgi:hypothetical protein